MTQWLLELWDNFLAFLGLARASERKAVPQRAVQRPPAVKPQQPKPSATPSAPTVKEVYAGDAFEIKPSTQRNASRPLKYLDRSVTI